jgi:MGT family glycosyltransferase
MKLASKLVLIATWDAGGTVVAYQLLIARLVRAGTRVVVLGNTSLGDRVISAGAEFIPFASAPDADPRAAAGDDRSFGAMSPAQTAQILSEHLLFGPAEGFFTDLAVAADQVQPDLIIVDHILLGAIVAAEWTGRPHVVCVTTVYPLPTAGVRGGPYRMLYARMLEKGLPRLNALRDRHDMAPLSRAADQYERADRMVVLTYRFFDPAAATAPPRVTYVGAQIGVPPELSQPTGDRRPTIVISPTTLGDPYARVLLDRLLDAVTGMDARVRVLGDIDPAMLGRDVPDNVSLLGFVPPEEALANADAIVTQGGHGTTIRALAFGLPVLGIPAMIDQFDNIRSVVELGAGIELHRDASVADLRDGLQRLLKDPSYRAHARAAAAELRAEHREDAVIDVIADAIEKHHLGSPT